MSNPVKIAAQLYEARDVMKSVLGTRFSAKMAEYQAVITQVAQKRNLTELQATMLIVETLQEKDPHSSGTRQTLYFAAVVEMLEPSV